MGEGIDGSGPIEDSLPHCRIETLDHVWHKLAQVKEPCHGQIDLGAETRGDLQRFYDVLVKPRGLIEIMEEVLQKRFGEINRDKAEEKARTFVRQNETDKHAIRLGKSKTQYY